MNNFLKFPAETLRHRDFSFLSPLCGSARELKKLKGRGYSSCNMVKLFRIPIFEFQIFPSLFTITKVGYAVKIVVKEFKEIRIFAEIFSLLDKKMFLYIFVLNFSASWLSLMITSTRSHGRSMILQTGTYVDEHDL